MILSFNEFIKESYSNSGVSYGKHSFDVDSYSISDDILDN